MKWEGREESKNVEDHRGMAVKGGLALGGGGLIIALIAMFLGVDPAKLANLVGPAGGQPQPGEQRVVDPAEERLANFAKIIFRDTEIVWNDLFQKNFGKEYPEPTLKLFTGQVNSACGAASAAVGPFYCPGDNHVFIDLSFYRQLEVELKAPGEFAKAYVLAHEVGHHVQKVLGYSDRVNAVRQSGDKVEANRASVRLELQADYLAGVWTYHAQKKFQYLERGDVESAMHAAQQIGDDKLQREATGRVRPDAFTHGTSKQRERWFRRGIERGAEAERNLKAECDLLFTMRYDDL